VIFYSTICHNSSIHPELKGPVIPDRQVESLCFPVFYLLHILDDNVKDDNVKIDKNKIF